MLFVSYWCKDLTDVDIHLPGEFLAIPAASFACVIPHQGCVTVLSSGDHNGKEGRLCFPMCVQMQKPQQFWVFPSVIYAYANM